ncbi:MAG: hypothetical protein HGA95_02185 [Caldiserica bacterium]|nr:hypothetical protein [Caldisericota bacterium]
MGNFDFGQIRSVGNSQNNGFEELVCQLAKKEHKDNKTYIRNGTPDGGVECYITDNDGREICYQAKYFFKIEDSEVKQIKESFYRACKTYPKMKEYRLAIPTNLSDSRDGKKNSARNKWDNMIGSLKTDKPEINISLLDKMEIP